MSFCQYPCILIGKLTEQLTEMLWNLRRVTGSELHDYHIHVDGVDRLDLADEEKPYCVASLSLGLLHFT